MATTERTTTRRGKARSTEVIHPATALSARDHSMRQRRPPANRKWPAGAILRKKPQHSWWSVTGMHGGCAVRPALCPNRASTTETFPASGSGRQTFTEGSDAPRQPCPLLCNRSSGRAPPPPGLANSTTAPLGREVGQPRAIFLPSSTLTYFETYRLF